MLLLDVNILNGTKKESDQYRQARHCFRNSVRVFQGLTLDRFDDRNDYDEERTISIDMIDDVLVVVVVHTDRNGVTQIISARPAKRAERQIHVTEISKRIDP
ncbi:MAG: BrnT family toxin [Alphaproteobacteria bacterium]